MGRITQVKSFWFDGEKIKKPSEMDSIVNQFLKDTPGILNTPDYFPEVSWGELGSYVICNITYQLTTHKVINTEKNNKNNNNSSQT